MRETSCELIVLINISPYRRRISLFRIRNAGIYNGFRDLLRSGFLTTIIGLDEDSDELSEFEDDETTANNDSSNNLLSILASSSSTSANKALNSESKKNQNCHLKMEKIPYPILDRTPS